MDDPHRKPGDKDRDALAARIKRAAEQGRIGAADRDIRLANVASAQSMAELDLIRRELDQLETTLPSGSTVTPGWTGPTPLPVADEIADKAVDAAKATARSIGVMTAVILVVLLVGAGVSALLAFSSSSDSGGNPGLRDPLPITAGPGADTSDEPPSSSPGRSAYSLSGRGIRSFLELYRTKFHTTAVIDLVMYGDYVVVDVPIPGKARHEGWLYRKEGGWTTFGGVRANAFNAQPVDTTQLAIPALVRNIARARATLGVEDPNNTYVIVRHFGAADAVPSVDIHVANQYGESGYLATRLDGTVEKAYPFGQ